MPSWFVCPCGQQYSQAVEHNTLWKLANITLLRWLHWDGCTTGWVESVGKWQTMERNGAFTRGEAIWVNLSWQAKLKYSENRKCFHALNGFQICINDPFKNSYVVFHSRVMILGIGWNEDSLESRWYDSQWVLDRTIPLWPITFAIFKDGTEQSRSGEQAIWWPLDDIAFFADYKGYFWLISPIKQFSCFWVCFSSYILWRNINSVHKMLFCCISIYCTGQ